MNEIKENKNNVEQNSSKKNNSSSIELHQINENKYTETEVAPGQVSITNGRTKSQKHNANNVMLKGVAGNHESDFDHTDKQSIEACEKLIKDKYETYFNKNNITEDRQKERDKTYGNEFCKQLAFDLLYPTEGYKKEIYKDCKSIVINAELVKSDGNNLAFINPILREYFFAKWSMDVIETGLNDYTAIKKFFLLVYILIPFDHHPIRSFINENLKEKQLTVNIFEDFNLLIKNNFLIPQYKRKTPLYIAVKENNLHIETVAIENCKEYFKRFCIYF